VRHLFKVDLIKSFALVRKWTEIHVTSVQWHGNILKNRAQAVGSTRRTRGANRAQTVGALADHVGQIGPRPWEHSPTTWGKSGPDRGSTRRPRGAKPELVAERILMQIQESKIILKLRELL
jgi:hypothetical protein